MPESPQVKRYLISRISNLVHELPYELPNNSRLRNDLRKLGNIRKMSNLGVDTAQYPVPLPQIKR